MFTCCAFFPLSLFFVLGPMFAAGRGWRAFLAAIGVELGLTAVLLLINVPTLIDDLHDWRTSGLMILPFAGVLLAPMAMGGMILYARHAESVDPGKHCRACGYDLRASPDRCPECGTVVRTDPERF